MARYGLVQPGAAWCGLVRAREARYGPVRPGLPQRRRTGSHGQGRVCRCLAKPEGDHVAASAMLGRAHGGGVT